MTEFETDFYLATMFGDLYGFVGAVTDIPLATEHLKSNYFHTPFTKGSVQSYDRGIDSDGENYRIERKRNMALMISR